MGTGMVRRTEPVSSSFRRIDRYVALYVFTVFSVFMRCCMRHVAFFLLFSWPCALLCFERIESVRGLFVSLYCWKSDAGTHFSFFSCFPVFVAFFFGAKKVLKRHGRIRKRKKS